jgi:hypothetical protein
MTVGRNITLTLTLEAGLNASPVALPIVGGDKKGNLEFETLKYGGESHGTPTWE